MAYKKKDIWVYELATYVYRYAPYQYLLRRIVQHSRTRDGIMTQLDRSPYLADRYKGRVHFQVTVLKGEHKNEVIEVSNSLDIMLNVPIE